MRSGTIQRKYFKTPFSAEYWRQACSELKDTRVLVFAALMLALRVVMKPLRIPIAADVNITFGFIVNALGAAVYGPVVAGFSAAVSDVLGYLIAPNGVYYVPFILTEIAGSVIFALFLYSTDITPVRLILAKFCVNLFVNILMTEPIMVQYYKLYMTSVYQPFMWIRIVKNLVMLPIESVILMIVFRAAIPALSKAGFKLAGGPVRGRQRRQLQIHRPARPERLVRGRCGRCGRIRDLRLQQQVLQCLLHGAGAAGEEPENERMGDGGGA